MALADAAELGGTFGLDPAQIRILMAGGLPIDARMPGNTEDDAHAAQEAANTITATDTVIALSASGNTAFPITIARIARHRGAQVIGIANNPDAALFTHAHVAICLPPPPCLQQANGAVKPAVLLALGVASMATAQQILDDTNGHLRAALARV